MSCPNYYKGICKAAYQDAGRPADGHICLLPNYEFRKCRYYRRQGAEGCVFTSAVCVFQNKPDDCYELTTLRSFRDGWVGRQKGGPEAVAWYYACSQHIVDVIGKEPDKDQVWKAVYRMYVAPAIAFIEAGDNPSAARLCVEMVKDLNARYVWPDALKVPYVPTGKGSKRTAVPKH